MWPHSGVDLGPIKMANIPDDRVVSKIVDCCQIDDVKQSCEYRIIYLSLFLKRCQIIESILILSRIQHFGDKVQHFTVLTTGPRGRKYPRWRLVLLVLA